MQITRQSQILTHRKVPFSHNKTFYPFEHYDFLNSHFISPLGTSDNTIQINKFQIQVNLCIATYKCTKWGSSPELKVADE